MDCIATEFSQFTSFTEQYWCEVVFKQHRPDRLESMCKIKYTKTAFI